MAGDNIFALVMLPVFGSLSDKTKTKLGNSEVRKVVSNIFSAQLERYMGENPDIAKIIVEKAILASDIGITPANDGKIIRISFPPLTEERRKELVKDINKMAEDSKVAIRSIRRDVIDKLKVMKKNNEITEDDVKKGETDAQKLTDKFVKKLDEVAAAKEKEVMSL